MRPGRTLTTRARTRGFSALRKGTGQLTGLPSKLPNVAPFQVLPNGQRAKGVNLCPSIAQERANPQHNRRFEVMFADWDASNIALQLDRAANVGSNVVRLIGTLYVTATGQLTRQQYYARWTELSQMCQARDLFLYPSGSVSTDAFGLLSNAQITAEMRAWAAHMATLPDIIGLDLVQEADAFALSAAGLALYQSVKEVTDLPLTYSSNSQADGWGPTRFADRADYLDLHIYTTYNYGQALLNYWNGGGSKAILVGEFSHDVAGSLASATDAATADRFDQVRANIVLTTGNQGQRLAGGLCWAAQDSSGLEEADGTWNSPIWNFGMWDYLGNERTTITSVLRQFPIT